MRDCGNSASIPFGPQVAQTSAVSNSERMSETYTLCPYCQEKVDPQDSGVRYGVEQVRIDRMGGFDLIDGMGGFFHPGCPMGAVGYVEREVPGSAA